MSNKIADIIAGIWDDDTIGAGKAFEALMQEKTAEVLEIAKDEIMSGVYNEGFDDIPDEELEGLVAESMEDLGFDDIDDLSEEQLNELSQETLTSYRNKAYRQGVVSQDRANRASKKAEKHDRKFSKHYGAGVSKDENGMRRSAEKSYDKAYDHNDKGEVAWDKASKHSALSKKRLQGALKANKRLAKEDTQLDELSNNTLGKYTKAVASDIAPKPHGKGEKDEKRERGYRTAIRKMVGKAKAKVNANEDTQLDELSINTKLNYAAKAQRQMKKDWKKKKTSDRLGDELYTKASVANRAQEKGKAKAYRDAGDAAYERGGKLDDRVQKREKGLNRLKRLTRESISEGHIALDVISDHMGVNTNKHEAEIHKLAKAHNVKVHKMHHNGPGGGATEATFKGKKKHLMKLHNMMMDDNYSHDSVGYKKMKKDYS